MIYILKKLYSKKIPTTSIFKTHVNFPNSCLHHPNCPLKHMLKVSWRKVLETDQIRATWAPFIVSKRSKTNSWRKVLETDQIRATWAPFIVSKRSKTNSWRKVLETDQIRATWAPFIVSKRSKTNSVSIARPRALNFEDYTTTQCPDRLQTGSIRRD